ncbi:MAG: transglycosylase SLT domain-containing protein [Myxococcales bacterium]|nr:transglycosylase SLT domain-containing protein [Myxococcales bacterium]
MTACARAQAPSVGAGEPVPANLAAARGVSGATTPDVGPGRDHLLERLLKALEGRLTVWETPKGQVVHVAHCRGVPGGCRARIAIFARWLADVADAFRVDPFLLAAIAVKESGLNPFAEGSAGELGIVQLHPKGVGRRAKFVRNSNFRQRCERSIGACQKEILEIGAEHLAQAITRCGDVKAALGAYNSGKCGETDYTRRVLTERDQMLRYAR